MGGEFVADGVDRGGHLVEGIWFGGVVAANGESAGDWAAGSRGELNGDDLLPAIQAVMRGDKYVSSSVRAGPQT